MFTPSAKDLWKTYSVRMGTGKTGSLLAASSARMPSLVSNNFFPLDKYVEIVQQTA